MSWFPPLRLTRWQRITIPLIPWLLNNAGRDGQLHAKNLQHRIREALETAPRNAGCAFQVGDFLVDIPPGPAGEQIVEKILLAGPIGHEGFATGIGVIEIGAEAEGGGLVDQAPGSGGFDADAAAAFQDKLPR